MATAKSIRCGTLHRNFEIRSADINSDDRSVVVSFSSEAPVERWFGVEVLDHSPEAVRLDRLRASGPLLVDHDSRDVVGVVERVDIGPDRKGRAVVRFGNAPRANEVLADVRDGIRKNMSVGYRVHRLERARDLEAENLKTGDVALEWYRAIDWEPIELSLVAVPADASIGVGRNQESEHEILVDTRGEHMSEEITLSPEANEARKDAKREERRRVQEILAVAERFELDREVVERAVQQGTSIPDFRSQVMASLKFEPVRTTGMGGLFGLPPKGARDFSLVRLINAQVDPRAVDAGYELEVCQETARASGMKPKGLMVPFEALGVQKRALSVGTTTAGGHLVETEQLAASFIEMLRNQSRVIELGATVLTGLQGHVTLPKQDGAATAAWVAEGGTITPSDQTFASVGLSPKLLASTTVFSRQLLVQSNPAIESVVRNDLVSIVGTEIDRAAINGSGSGSEPLGILGISGVNSVSIGTNGGAPTYAHVVDLQKEVAIDNADRGVRGFLTNAKVRAKLLRTDKGTDTGKYVWEADEAAMDGRIIGVRALLSENVPSNLVKGTSGAVCSAIIYGNWADLLIGLWGGVDIVVDPYTAAATGQVKVFIYQFADIDVRWAQSFGWIKDAITT